MPSACSQRTLKGTPLGRIQPQPQTSDLAVNAYQRKTLQINWVKHKLVKLFELVEPFEFFRENFHDWLHWLEGLKKHATMVRWSKNYL